MQPTFNPLDLATMGGISTLTWLLVQAIKRCTELSGRGTVLVAAGVGVGLGAIGLLWQSPVTAQKVATCVMIGLLGGLGAVGLDVGGRAAAGSEV
jgi:hypothetical protein